MSTQSPGWDFVHEHDIYRPMNKISLSLCSAIVLTSLSACSLRQRISPRPLDPPTVTHATLLPDETDGNLGESIHVQTIGLSADGEQLVVAGTFGLSLHSTDTLETLWFSTADNPLGINVAAFGPDDESILTGSRDGIVTTWDTQTGDPIHSVDFGIADQIPSITSLAFHPDHTVLALGFWGGDVAIWNSQTEQIVQDYKFDSSFFPEERGGQETYVVWSPDGSTFAAGGWDGALQILDTQTGDVLETIESEHGIDNISWSSDGTRLAMSAGFSVTVMSIATGEMESLPYEGPAEDVVPGGPVTGLSWSPDGSLIALGTWDGRVLVWNVADHSLNNILQQHTGGVHTIVWSPQGDILYSGSYDNTVVVWDVGRGVPIKCLWCTVEG
jgi:WD40 repeat protein